ncbi:MAG: AraC family transcriptional regulator [Alphaproteobacteria bacterium]|nr:AraC family transcriptional regulator [Alphaproteobacteria bacterium]MBU1514965.1 AraC family transcriptional regulator [Alphaproteobacteria bacterium]MBU2095598.1 AraC family transcriptional regulator [Alphaproteobacteria bacterium]MBU2149716.1 AraC family transcriptional regulator [Alphaproteobacteria bacterium]MBU2309059.1 AraC family transcriptional regulator [Alphaproteobacteria bacterium]
MSAPPLRQRLTGGELARHRHAEGYLAVVLAGGYEEAGEGGRRQVAPGDVIVHHAFEAHMNRVPGRGAVVLNLPLLARFPASFGRIADPDAIARVAERDPLAAFGVLEATFAPVSAADTDWPDDLARLLAAEPASLQAWAEARGLSAEHLSRGFRKVFGVAPQRFGLEARARAAAADAATTGAALASIAFDRGFADQAHMTRAVAAVTGRTPGAWRISSPFKTPA